MQVTVQCTCYVSALKVGVSTLISFEVTDITSTGFIHLEAMSCYYYNWINRL